MYLTLILATEAQDQPQLATVNRPVPFDTATRTGMLPNGMRYYVRYNARPADYAELRLALNAGALQESDDQLGLAHFVEHMCFNGTKNFPKADLVNYLESVGTKFGPHLNAYTSFDETVYVLRVQTDEPEAFATGLQILEDWAHQVSFEGEEIDKERGVVIEEWRTRLGARERMNRQTSPKVFYGSRYPDRFPIGDTGVLRTFEYETLRSFYRDWYRPDLMAVVAVGDFDVDSVEAMIKAQFSVIPAHEDAPTREVYHVADHEETLIAMASDPEANYNQIRVLYKHPHRPIRTLEDYRRDLVYGLASSLIDARLSELTQLADPPFSYVGSGYGNLVRNKDQYATFALVPNGGFMTGLRTILEENTRAIQHGFTSSELSRVKQSLLTALEQQYAERDKIESRRLVMRYVYHFLEGTPVPGLAQQLALAQEILPQITLEEVNDAFRQFITEENRLVVMTGAEKTDNPLPKEADVRALLEEAQNWELAPYADNVATGPLMRGTPEPGKVVRRETREELGVTELTLANGVKIILKPTDFQNNQVLMSAFSAGGSSLYDDEDYMSADYAASIVSESGLADFDPIQLEKYLSDKVVSLSPYIGELSEGMRGSCSTNDLETFLQMVHLYVTQPRRDEQAFQAMMAKNEAMYANVFSNPELWFRAQVYDLINQGHNRRQFIESPEQLAKIDLEKAHRIFQERFANAGDFTYVFVGTFEVPQMEQLLLRYLGSMPGQPESESWEDVGARVLDQALDTTFYRGKEPKSKVVMQFHRADDWDLGQRFKLNAAVDVLKIMMRESMREEQGGVYGVRAGASVSRYPVGGYTVNVSFTCAPENVDQLKATVLKEVKALQEAGPSSQNMQKVTETMRKSYQVQLEQNRYWLNVLAYTYENELAPERILQYEEKLNALTPADVQAAAQAYMQVQHLTSFVLKPETEQLDAE